MKKRIIISSVVLFCFTCFFSSCVKDNFDLDKLHKGAPYDASFAVPAAWGDIGFYSVLEYYNASAMFIKNENGFVSLQYKARVKSDTVQSIIYVPDQQITQAYTTPDVTYPNFNNYQDTVSIVNNFNLKFSFFNSEAEIDSLLLKQGLINLKAQSSYRHGHKLYITMPTVTKNGKPFTRILSFMPGGGSISSLDNDLKDYKINFTSTSLGYNEIPIECKLTLFYSGPISNEGGVTIDAEIKDLNYKVIYGFFGLNTLIFQSDTIDISLFKNKKFTIQDYKFVDPKFKVYYWNSYGVPSQFYFTHVVANSSIDDVDYNVMSYGAGLPVGEFNPHNVSYSSTLGDYKHDSLKLNKENSNIADIINKRPKWIQFKAKATTNPLNKPHNNFISDVSEMAIETVVEFPLWGYIHNFASTDTAKFDLSPQLKYIDAIKRFMVRIDITNGFPCEMSTQVYFVDSNYQILDSLFDSTSGQLLLAAQVDGEGQVKTIEQKISKIEVNKDKLERIKTCKNIIFKARASSTAASQQQCVKIYPEYRIKFNLGLEVDIDTELKPSLLN